MEPVRLPSFEGIMAGGLRRRRYLTQRRLFRTLLCMPIAGLFSTGWPTDAAAQLASSATGTVTGTVTGEAAAGLTGVEVRVLETGLTAVTNQDGTFGVARVPTGDVVLEFRMIGYRTTSLPVQVPADATLNVEVALEVDPVPLDPLEVRASDRLSPEMRGFYERRERGTGHFFTRDEIAVIGSALVTDVLRRAPGVRVESTRGTRGASQSARMRRATGISGARPCPVLYYVNGLPFPLDADLGIDQFVRPDEIAGIEVYSGPSQLPARFHAADRGARCGVIIIWTYAGERAPG